MSSQGPNNPGTTNGNVTPGDIAWVSAANIVSSNDARASVVFDVDVFDELSRGLLATNFGFTVPTGSTIDGVLVEIEKQQDMANVFDYKVRLVKDDVATSAGPNSPATVVNIAGGDVAWLTPGNATASDNSYATCVFGPTNDATSQGLKCTAFGFGAIPTSAIIKGFVVEVERKESASSVRDYSIRLMKLNVPVSANLADTPTEWPTSDAYASYGGPTNLWGTTWVRGDVVTSTFGVLIQCSQDNGLEIASIDHVRMTIYYSVPLEVGDDKRILGAYWPTGADAYSSYGGAADAWNAGLTPGDVNSVAFGVILQAMNEVGGETASVDHVRITVYFSPYADVPPTRPPPRRPRRWRRRPISGEEYASGAQVVEEAGGALIRPPRPGRWRRRAVSGGEVPDQPAVEEGGGAVVRPPRPGRWRRRMVAGEEVAEFVTVVEDAGGFVARVARRVYPRRRVVSGSGLPGLEDVAPPPPVFPVLWSLAPTDRVVEGYGYRTDVMTAYDGTEQRVSLRGLPVESVTFDFSALAARESELAEAVMFGTQDEVLLVPLWNYGTRVGAAVNPGDLVLQVADADVVPYVVGDHVLLWSDPFAWELAQVTAAGAGTVSLAAAVGGTWPAGTLALPARRSRLGDRVLVQRATSSVLGGSLTFALERPW